MTAPRSSLARHVRSHTAPEELDAMRLRAWRRQGVVVLKPEEIVDPWVRQMDSVRQALRALDVDAAPHEPARTMAQRVRERLGTAGDALVEMLHTIDRQRYGRLAIRRPDMALTRRFRAQARMLRRNRSSTPAV